MRVLPSFAYFLTFLLSYIFCFLLLWVAASGGGVILLFDFEIYNEQISDLLKPERSNLAIREDKKRGVFVEGLSEWVVRSPAEIYGLMERGAQVPPYTPYPNPPPPPLPPSPCPPSLLLGILSLTQLPCTVVCGIAGWIGQTARCERRGRRR